MAVSWTITRDFLDGDDVGTVGPSSAPLSHAEIRKHPKRERFRMYDDDKALYYEGFIVGAEEGFEPLDHFGMPNAGCTTIKYFNKTTGKLEIL